MNYFRNQMHRIECTSTALNNKISSAKSSLNYVLNYKHYGRFLIIKWAEVTVGLYLSLLYPQHFIVFSVFVLNINKCTYKETVFKCTCECVCVRYKRQNFKSKSNRWFLLCEFSNYDIIFIWLMRERWIDYQIERIYVWIYYEHTHTHTYVNRCVLER